MLGQAICSVHEEQVNAAAAQRRVLAQARVPAHVARVQDHLRRVSAHAAKPGFASTALQCKAASAFQAAPQAASARTWGETFVLRWLKSKRNMTAPGHCSAQQPWLSTLLGTVSYCHRSAWPTSKLSSLVMWGPSLHMVRGWPAAGKHWEGWRLQAHMVGVDQRDAYAFYGDRKVHGQRAHAARRQAKVVHQQRRRDLAAVDQRLQVARSKALCQACKCLEVSRLQGA